MKNCTKCRTVKPFEDFPRNPRMVSGFDSHCKTCRKEARTEKSKKNNPGFWVKVKNFETQNKDVRKCRKCLVEQSLLSFPFFNIKRNERGYTCNPCMNILNKQRYLDKKEEILLKSKDYYRRNVAKTYLRNRRNVLRKKFGLSWEDYLTLVKKCKNKCEICGTPQEDLKRRLAVDHNHLTGRIRGMLCLPCNQAIGMLKSDIGVNLLKAAIKYINKKDLYNERN